MKHRPPRLLPLSRTRTAHALRTPPATGIRSSTFKIDANALARGYTDELEQVSRRLFQIPIRSFKSFRAALQDDVMREQCGILKAHIVEHNLGDDIEIRVQHRTRISPKLAARFPKLARIPHP